MSSALRLLNFVGRTFLLFFLPCKNSIPPRMTEIIKDGYLSVKEEGLRAWIWSKRFCVLRDQALTFHRNEVKSSGRASAACAPL